MKSATRPPLTALYVPGDRPDRFSKAAGSGADVVILDLEDSVAPERKHEARAHVADWLKAEGTSAVRAQVRINSPSTARGREDLDSLPPDTEVRVPKVESPSDIDVIGERPAHALVESAAGIEHIFAIAAHPLVVSIGLGEADLTADLGITDASGLSWMRVRAVVAARAAGLPAPMMTVYADIPDLDGLAESCAAGKGIGMRGRVAIHPRQLPVIARAFAPTQEETAWARDVLSALDEDTRGVAVLPSGAMVDEAMARRARTIIGRG